MTNMFLYFCPETEPMISFMLDNHSVKELYLHPGTWEITYLVFGHKSQWGFQLSFEYFKDLFIHIPYTVRTIDR